jgi:hypothetical protein
MFIDLIFYCAVAALILHSISSGLLERQIRGEEDLIRQLFVLPNAWLGNRTGPLHLRAKYFLPWTESPELLAEYHFPIRAAYQIARWSGFAVPVCFLSFFAIALVQAGN